MKSLSISSHRASNQEWPLRVPTLGGTKQSLPSTRLPRRSAPRNDKNGFTIIEVIVVIGIIGVISGLSLLISQDYFFGNSFRSERNILVSTLSRARTLAMTNSNQTTHGVYIDDGEMTLFEGSYVAGDPKNIVIETNVENSGPAQTIIFEQLSGKVASNVTVTLIAKNGESGEVTINQEGRINW